MEIKIKKIFNFLNIFLKKNLLYKNNPDLKLQLNIIFFKLIKLNF